MSDQPRAAPTNMRSVAVLCVLGVATLVLYRIAVHARTVSDMVWFLELVAIQIVVYVAAAWLSFRTKDSRQLLLLGLVFAALFRLSILFAPPYLSDDIYRYVWDGRVQSAGINPYRYIPADESLGGLRDEKIYPHINRRDYAHTMYPPVAEGAFLLATRFSESVTWMKAAMAGFEAITVWALLQLLVSFGFARQRVLLYAWHPLAVWEFAGSGHVDALAVMFIALALLVQRKHRETLAGLFLGCATCVKLFPAVLFPAFYARRSWKLALAFAATILIAYLPYLSVGPVGVLGFLPGYASERGMVSGDQYFLLAATRRILSVQIPTIAYVIFATAVLATLSLWVMRDRARDELAYLRNGLLIASVFLLLLAPHFPWYFAWLIPFLCFVPSPPAFYLTFASFVLYLTWFGDSADRLLLLKSIIFVPFLVLSVAQKWITRKQSRSSP